MHHPPVRAAQASRNRPRRRAGAGTIDQRPERGRIRLAEERGERRRLVLVAAAGDEPLCGGLR